MSSVVVRDECVIQAYRQYYELDTHRYNFAVNVGTLFHQMLNKQQVTISTSTVQLPILYHTDQHH